MADIGEKKYNLIITYDDVNATKVTLPISIPPGPEGRGIESTKIENGRLIVKYTGDAKEYDIGPVGGGGGDGSGGSITVDNQLSSDSTNPVQNKVITDKLAEIEAMVSYVEPTISTLQLANTNSSYEITSEAGVQYNLAKFTHKETNKANIEGTLSFKKGSSTLISGIEPTDTATEITVTDNNTVKSAQTITYTLTGTSKKGKTISKSASVTFYYASYIGANENGTANADFIPKLTKVQSSSLSGTKTVTVNSNGYIWFITTGTISKITSGGFDVPFSNQGNYTYNGGTYKWYRTDNVIIPGTYTYDIS